MASADAPDAAAAMAVDREAEGAGAILGPEEDIDDDVLSNLLSASCRTPPVVDEKYGRHPWTPLEGSLVEQRFAASTASPPLSNPPGGGASPSQRGTRAR